MCLFTQSFHYTPSLASQLEAFCIANLIQSVMDSNVEFLVLISACVIDTLCFALQVEAFCIANLIQSVMDSNDEFLVLDVHFAATNGGLQYAFELLHQVLQSPW
jgi:hypothetical protein